jgi:enamine deaminase RidA (YjgF/YER057c/UK114 family)
MRLVPVVGGAAVDVRDAYANARVPPASTTVAISKRARKDALIEVGAVAVLPPK